MAEKFFPFTSLDDDRLYGSVDFRSFFRTILGDGRCSYDEIGIVDPTQSMLCTKDTLDNTKIEVSPGACYLFGAIFQTTDPLSLTVELPTGSTQNRGCVVARISDDIDRRINIITVEPESAVDEETDLILADYISAASGIVSVTDRMIVAFAKYHLSKSQQDYIIAQLGVNEDLINYLSQNSQLITLISQNSQLLNLLGSSTTLVNLLANNTNLHVGLANNQDFIDLIKGTKAENYTFFVNSVDDILKIHRFDAGNDFSNILIRAGTYEITNSMLSWDYLMDTSGGRIKRITGEEGAKIILTNGGSSRIFVIGTSNSTERVTTVRNLEIECITTNNSASCSGFQRCLLVERCKATFTGPTTNGNDNIFAGDCSGVNDCTIISATGETFAALINCTNINNFRITSVSRFRRLFENCNHMNNIVISALYNANETVTVNIFNLCYNITNVYCTHTSSAIAVNVFNRCTNFSNINIAVNIQANINLLINCSKASNLSMSATSTVAAQALNTCDSISDSTFTLAGTTSNGNVSSNYLTNIVTNFTPAAATVDGYNTCSYMSNCSIEFLGTTGTERRGFNGCSTLNNCRASNQTTITNFIAFNSCTKVINPTINGSNITNFTMFNYTDNINNLQPNVPLSNNITNLYLAIGCKNISGVTGLISANTITVFGNVCTGVSDVTLSVNVTGSTNTILKIVDGGDHFNSVKFDISGSYSNDENTPLINAISHLTNFTVSTMGAGWADTIIGNSNNVSNGTMLLDSDQFFMIYGLKNTTRVANTIVQYNGAYNFTGFQSCSRTNNCRVQSSNSNLEVFGFVSSNFGHNNYAGLSNANRMIGFQNCNDQVGNSAEIVANSDVLSCGFQGGVRFVDCFSRVTNSGPLVCFNETFNVSNSSAYVVSSAGSGHKSDINSGKFGFYNCLNVDMCRTSLLHNNSTTSAILVGYYGTTGTLSSSFAFGNSNNNISNYYLAVNCYGCKNNGWVGSNSATNYQINVYSNCYASKQNTTKLPVSTNANNSDVATYGFNFGTVVD